MRLQNHCMINTDINSFWGKSDSLPQGNLRKVIETQTECNNIMTGFPRSLLGHKGPAKKPTETCWQSAIFVLLTQNYGELISVKLCLVFLLTQWESLNIQIYPSSAKKCIYLLLTQKTNLEAKNPHYNGKKVQGYVTLLLWHLAYKAITITQI